MPPRLLARPGRLVALAVLLGLLSAGIWAWQSARTSTPVSPEDALATFREGGGAAEARRPGAPRPGVYTYRQEGSERAAAGPLSVTRSLPAEARYVVRLTPDGYQEELALSEEHTEALRLRLGREGSRAVWRRTEVRFAGVGRDDRRELRPPPLHRPRELAVGRTWGGRYAAGELPVAYRSRVLRRDAVSVAGRRVPVVVIRTEGDTGGVHPGRRVDTVWWAPGPALPVRWRIEMEIEGVVSLRTRADLTLVDLEPAR